MRNFFVRPAVALVVTLTAAAALGWVALPAAATSFQPGDLCLLSHALPAPGGGSLYGIVRIEPLSGVSTLLYASSTTLWTTLAYDPFRDLLVFAHPDSLLLGVSADGVVTQLATPASAPQALAARGDGIIYMQIGTYFYYLDASNAQHPLLDIAGTGTFNLAPGGVVTEMRYDDLTNSLITLSAGAAISVCPDWTQVCAGKIPLTISGTQVASPMAGAQVDVSTTSELMVGSGRRDDGKILVVVDTNSNNQENRMQLLDPVTMTLTPYAANGYYIGAAVISAGTYSNVRGQAVIDDSFHDELRGFSQGTVGDGVTFSTSATGYGVSSSGHSELARMTEISGPVSTGVRSTRPRSGLVLEAPYPNPFNPSTTFRFELERASRATLEIFDVRGRRVRTLTDEHRAAGWHLATWDGSDEHGERVASGVYFARLESAGEARQQRFVLVR